MPDPKPARAPLPPRWFIRLAWIAHRRLCQWTGGRLGLWRPRPGGWGAMSLITTGRRTGRARPVITTWGAGWRFAHPVVLLKRPCPEPERQGL